MKKIKLLRIFTLMVVSLSMWSASYAQSEQSKYRLIYNVCTARYEVHFVAQTAFALTIVSSGRGALQVGTCSVGIVLPANAPDDFLQVTPVNGGAWDDNATRYAPIFAPSSDFHHVETTGKNILFAMGQTSIPAGTDIILFTFTTTPAQCFTGARLFRNWVGDGTLPCSSTMQWPNATEEGTSVADPCSGEISTVGPPIITFGDYRNSFQLLPANLDSYRGNLSNTGTFCTGFDYGDLTSAWPSAKAGIINADCNGDGVPDNAGNGPSVWAGATIDADPAQYFSANANLANGDDITGLAASDEDGLAPPAQNLNFGYTYNFSVTMNSNVPGTRVYYGLWIDWNNNGNFADDVDGNGNQSFYSGSGVAMSPVTVAVPVKTPQYNSSVSISNYKARLIVSDVPVDATMFGATIANGEVEDYQAPSPILPVIFGGMSAQAKDCNVYVNFDILTQQNASRFEIEYSADGGLNWSLLATIPASGTSSVAHSYSYIHNRPIAGINLYRIKDIDKDGKFMYSDALSANNTCLGKGGIVSYPNPVHAALTVLLPINTGKVQLRITDATGKLVQNITTETSVNTINTNLLSSGMYLLEVMNANKVVYSSKFIKE
ncbi:MAG: T9SS type A sorting domain-containing protein [Chitinophagaceae bacterium]